MSVENLLLFTGQPPNFEREDFPPRKDIYPFKLHLDPLSQKSLAKYVVAESAIDEPDIEDIKKVAMDAKGGATINHVGILYALLGLIFSTKEQIEAGGTSADAWEKMLHGLWQVAKCQNPNPEAWHLRETAFHPESEPQQAHPDDWQTPQPSGLRVHRVKARDEARAAIRDIAEQGEGPTSGGTSGGMTSHFTRFSGIYRKVYPLHDPPTLPSLEKWATRAVPTDPKPSDFTETRTRGWAELADLRYALLLGFLEHYLLTTGDDRQLLTGWIFSEMRSRLGYIAELLTKMPRGDGDGGVAGAPFTLREPLHLPAVETGRWKVHMKRLELAIAKIQELQGGSDAADEFLKKLLASDKNRLALVSAKAEAQRVTTSFERDILPLFRPIDIEHMIKEELDLSSYEEVKTSVQSDKPNENILNRVQGIGGHHAAPAALPVDEGPDRSTPAMEGRRLSPLTFPVHPPASALVPTGDSTDGIGGGALRRERGAERR